MNKKQRLIILVILLYFPVFTYAAIVIVKPRHDSTRGEFASPVGVFNSKLNIISHGEFKTPTGTFTHSSGEFKVSSSEFKTPQGEFKFSLVE